MITDFVKLYVKAGNGGNGCVSFHREKYVSHGGPDGGDGGNGGNIILVIEEGDNTLLKYKYHHKFIAQNGGDGKTNKFHGPNGEDIILPVPPGTVVKDAETGKVIIDMSDREPFVLCRGGRGGWGNRHFATPTRQIPRFAKSGLKGEEREVIFELKMLADVALIGLPNVGKSSLLSVISSATPKIADYDFTTLSPNLGVVKIGEGKGFVAADIPGLIEGASDGRGLGHKFLRHIDRCRLMLHVVDVSADCDRDPIADMKMINEELAKYNSDLAERPQLIVANKYDASLPEYNEHVMNLEAYCKEQCLPLVFVSAATRHGIQEMVKRVAEMLAELPPLTIFEPDFVPESYDLGEEDEMEITRDGAVFVCESEWLWRLVGRVNFEDRDSLAYFQRMLRTKGIIDQLIAAGVKDGDTVRMYDFEFDFLT
ncbi:MAG: GTPase ObgE [Ruminococcaceae bacterium]|nr:GTPase ObgE [Oscillospiraceae bacterium]